MNAIVWSFEHSFTLFCFGTRMKTDLFQSYDHCWVFQICWCIECSSLTALCFRTLNSLAGIPSSPLALLIVLLPKVHLPSHTRLSGSAWVTTTSWLSVLLRPFFFFFLYSCSVFSCHLFLIFSVSNWSYGFCPLLCPCLHEMFPWYLQLSWRDL